MLLSSDIVITVIERKWQTIVHANGTLWDIIGFMAALKKILHAAYVLLFAPLRFSSSEGAGIKDATKRSLVAHASIVIICAVFLPVNFLLALWLPLFVVAMGMYVFAGYAYLKPMPHNNLFGLAVLTRILLVLQPVVALLSWLQVSSPLPVAYVLNIPAIQTTMLLYSVTGLDFLGYSPFAQLIIVMLASLLPAAGFYAGLRLKIWAVGRKNARTELAQTDHLVGPSKLGWKGWTTWKKALAATLASLTVVPVMGLYFVALFFSLLWITPWIPAVASYRSMPAHAASYEASMQKSLVWEYGGVPADWRMLSYGYSVSGSTYLSYVFSSEWKHVPTGAVGSSGASPFDYPVGEFLPHFDDSRIVKVNRVSPEQQRLAAMEEIIQKDFPEPETELDSSLHVEMQGLLGPAAKSRAPLDGVGTWIVIDVETLTLTEPYLEVGLEMELKRIVRLAQELDAHADTIGDYQFMHIRMHEHLHRGHMSPRLEFQWLKAPNGSAYSTHEQETLTVSFFTEGEMLAQLTATSIDQSEQLIEDLLHALEESAER